MGTSIEGNTGLTDWGVRGKSTTLFLRLALKNTDEIGATGREELSSKEL